MKNKDLEIKKLHSLLQDNAHSSDLMCKHYCTTLLFTHTSYQNKLNLQKFLNHLKNFYSDFEFVIPDITSK